jgi:hypothetical protein
MCRSVAIAGTAGEVHDDRHVQTLAEPDRLLEHLVVCFCAILVRMERIAVARQRADRQAGVGDHLLVLASRRWIGQQQIELDVSVSGPATRSQLDRVDAPERAHLCEHVLDAQRRKDGCEESNFHTLFDGPLQGLGNVNA